MGGLLRVSLGLCSDARIVQDKGHETAHGTKGKPRQELADLLWVIAQVPEGA